MALLVCFLISSFIKEVTSCTKVEGKVQMVMRLITVLFVSFYLQYMLISHLAK